MSRRAAAVAMVALVLAGLVAVDRLNPPPKAAAADAPASAPQPMATDAGARNGAWFCPGGPTDRLDQGDTSVILANDGEGPIAASVTAIPATGANKDIAAKTYIVPAASSLTVRLADILGAAVPAGANVVAAPGIVVSQSSKAPEGAVVSPCASSAADHWYTAAGSTAAGTSHYLSLLNPFPSDAIADLAFSTDQGRAVPADLQGVLVPGRSLVVLDLGDKVRRREEVASEVVVRRGRLVVGRTFRKGTATSVVLAAPAGDSTWYLPGGVRAEGVASRLVVANPSDADAEVTAELRMQEGAAEPLTLEVPAQSRATLNLDTDKVPRGVPYALVVRTANDVPVVVERSVETRSGRSDVLGSRVAARAWISPGGAARAADSVALLNTGEGEAAVTVSVLDGSSRAIGQPVRIPPGARGSFKVPDEIRGRALQVTADQPVVVERDAGDVTAAVGGAIAVPLSRG